MYYPDDWIHWQRDRRLDDSAIAKYVGRGEKLKGLLRCPADSFDGRKQRPGTSPGQGPYLYSYGMNVSLARNWMPFGRYRHSSRITQWRPPSRKIVLGEPWMQDVRAANQPTFDYAEQLARSHGTAVFHGDVPGFPRLSRGMKNGSNASIAFLDGHVESLDQDAIFDNGLFQARFP
jgi:prepilin-type processing-associated H-X9-DG protein